MQGRITFANARPAGSAETPRAPLKCENDTTRGFLRLWGRRLLVNVGIQAALSARRKAVALQAAGPVWDESRTGGLPITGPPRPPPEYQHAGARNWGFGSASFSTSFASRSWALQPSVFSSVRAFICSGIRRKKLSPIPVHAIVAV